MSKSVLLFFILPFSFSIHAQTCQWAFTASLAPRSQAVAVKEDLHGNFYVASYTDSMSTRLYTQFQKFDANQQPLWMIRITGNAGISDLEVNPDNHTIVVGSFEGTMTVNTHVFTTTGGQYRGFIMKTNETGTVLWIHLLNPVNNDFHPKDLYIASA